MPDKPKTWAEEEITGLIADEIRACQESDFLRDRTTIGMAEVIYALLDDRGLIEHTP
jgi:hypothetical protein